MLSNNLSSIKTNQMSKLNWEWLSQQCHDINEIIYINDSDYMSLVCP
jgi:hypothetical protein